MSLPLRTDLEGAPQSKAARHHFWRRMGNPSNWRLIDSARELRSRSFAYEVQDAPQTLREGLHEYYASDPNLLAPTDLSDPIAKGLRAHDAAHVVFGCDTSIRGEVILARWSLLGSQDGISIYARGLRSKETRYLFADFVKKLRPLILLLAVIDGARALFRSLRMHKQWPTLGWEQHADRPLAEIRSDFGIRVV